MAPTLPTSRDALAAHQRTAKRRAVEHARRAPFFKGKLDHVDLDRLEEPEEWAKIPLLEKDALREIPNDRFFEQFCIAPQSENLGVLAFGRVHRQTAVLPAHLRRHRLRHGGVPPLV